VALLQRINASRRFFLSSTIVDGRMTIRACILSVHTHRDRIDELVQLITQLTQPEALNSGLARHKPGERT